MPDLSLSIRRVAILAMLGFALQSVYLCYWQVYRAPGLRANPYNTRAQNRLREIQPGHLLDRTGSHLLASRRGARGYERVYPEGRHVCHLTGYNEVTGLQASLRDAFLGIGEYEKPWHEFTEGLASGNDVRLTIDLQAQHLATRLLEGHRGAVVALDARDGAVLVLVSAPGYDPATLLDNEWEYNLFREDPAAPELNRALQGLYPPGSVMKIFTAAVALDLGRVTPESRFKCEGTWRVDGRTITCPRPHGQLTFKKALAVSCNCTFARMGQHVTGEEFRQYVKRFHLLDPANLGMPSQAGRMGDVTGPKGSVVLAETAFGQGPTLLTPLQIARLTLTIARGGQVLQPYIVAEVTNRGGRRVKTGGAQDLGQAISPTTAQAVAGMMVQVVERGTAAEAGIRGMSVAAKTGSAQNPHGAPHAWFTAFAPADAPGIVVTVVVENGGSGAEVALPIARQLLTLLLENR